MGWKSSSKTAPPPPTPPSTLSKLLPLLVLVVVVAVAGFVAFHIYCAASQVADSATKKLEKKHVTFNRDGVKVAVKEVQNEKYVDNTQSVLVKAWNLSSLSGQKVDSAEKDAGTRKR